MNKTTTKQAKFELRKLGELTNWENNPRSILKEDYNRLKQQIERLGVYKTLLVNQDNTVLGGNMRLRAFKELFGDAKEVMCGIVETKDDGEMLEYALSDNDQAGTTDDMKLAEVFALHPIDTQLYKIQSNVLRPLESIINPPDPITEGGDGDPDRSELDEDLQSYMGGNIKQIVLYFDNAKYEETIKRLEALMTRMSVENHTDAFIAMLSFTEENYAEPM